MKREGMRLRDRSLGLAVSVSLTGGCVVGDFCGNKVLARVSSPAGQHVAIVFERDCGATTGFSTQVSILDARACFRERPSLLFETVPGNALAIDDDHGLAPAGPGGGPEVGVQWSDETHATFTYHLRARASHAPERVGDVAVTHVRAASAWLRPRAPGAHEGRVGDVASSKAP